MSDNSKIQWTDASWPVTVGCDHVSAGCDNCYAARLTSGRLAHRPEYAGLAEGGRFNGTVRCLPERLDWPLKWRKPRMIFVCSMSDLFHESVPDEFIARVFAVMASAQRHTFQVLTKRHARMRSLLSSPAFAAAVSDETARLLRRGLPDFRALETWPLPNVWLGVSVEDKKWADIRIPALLRTPAVVRFLSCEPLLGPINLWHWIDPSDPCVDCDRCGEECFPDEIGVGHILIGGDKWCDGPSKGALPRRIDWVIAGGESGPGARPMHPAWAREIRDHCTAAEIPFFFKQHGDWIGGSRIDYDQGEAFHPVSDHALAAWHWPGDGHPAAYEWPDGVAAMRVGKKQAGRLLDGREWNEFPVAARTAA